MSEPPSEKQKRMSVETLLGRELNDIEAKNAPKILFTEGTIQIPVPGPRVAIVGTRQPSNTGLKTAYEISSELARKGVVIASGLARGIDTQAHRGAIDVGGKTFAVLGTPVNKVCPPENKELQTTMANTQLLISQFPQEKPVQRRNFVIRNRTLALLCDASIIIEAGESSGTLSQGWETLRLGRPLFIWHTAFDNDKLSWPETFKEYGAVEFSSVERVLDELPSGNHFGKILLQ